jgi:hypothetical protein
MGLWHTEGSWMIRGLGDLRIVRGAVFWMARMFERHWMRYWGVWL